MQAHKTSFSYTANSFSHGPLNAESAWVILHGYGQRADDFLKHFEFIKNTLIIAPEAPSQFYLKGLARNIGSSWMSSRFREDAIKNYINYLNQLHAEFDLGRKKLHILGFSQGSETATRWVNQLSTPAEELVLWAGRLAPEIKSEEITSKTKLRQIVGSKDKLVSKESLLDNVILFEGKHEISEDLLKIHL